MQYAVTDQIIMLPKNHAQNAKEDDTPEASARFFRMGKQQLPRSSVTVSEIATRSDNVRARGRWHVFKRLSFCQSTEIGRLNCFCCTCTSAKVEEGVFHHER